MRLPLLKSSRVDFNNAQNLGSPGFDLGKFVFSCVVLTSKPVCFGRLISRSAALG